MREILLRDKAPEFLETSPKGTVPVIVTDNSVIEESLEIMDWALSLNDPEGWLDFPSEGRALIAECDGPFKTALDRYKYQNRHNSDPDLERGKASNFIQTLEDQLKDTPYLYGQTLTLPDMAILTFIRQFANTDRAWFDAQDWPRVLDWLTRFTESARFAKMMQKYPVWSAGDPVTVFA